MQLLGENSLVGMMGRRGKIGKEKDRRGEERRKGDGGVILIYT